MTRPRIAIPFLALLALGACVTDSGGGGEGKPSGRVVRANQQAGGGAGELGLGTNLIGEPCSAESSRGDSEQLYRVRCGNWDQPSARVARQPVPANLSLQDIAAASGWRNALEQRMTCEDPETIQILDAIPAQFLNCKLRNGGWPFVALAAATRDALFLADGIPAALPAVESLIGQVSGMKPRETGAGGQTARSTGMERLAATLKDRLFGTGDLQDYYRLMRLGQYYTTIKDHADATKAYRDALAVHQRVLGADNPESADAVMHLALSLTNQESFREANSLLAQADRLLTRDRETLEKARLLSYRAINLANQGRRQEALELAREATAMRRRIRAALSPVDETAASAMRDRDSFALAEGAGVLANMGAEAATVDIAQSLFIEAGLLLRMGDIPGAQRARDDAVGTLRKARASPEWWGLNFLDLEADMALNAGRFAEAEGLYRRLAEEWNRQYPKTRPAGMADIALGRALAAGGKLAEALDVFRKGRATLLEAGGGLRYAQIQPYLDTLARLAERDGAARPALHAEMFETAQLARSGVTARSIALAAARLSASDRKVGEVIRERQEAERERVRLQGLFNDKSAAPRDLQDRAELTRLRNELGELDARLRALDEQVQAAASGYNQLIEAPTTAESVLALLKPGEALVSMVLGEQAGYLFVLRDGTASAHALAFGLAEATEQVALLRTGVEAEFGGRVPVFNAGRAHSLYNQVLGPAKERLDGVRELFVAPTGPLLSLPFALLVDRPPPAVRDYDYRQVSFLARSMSVSLIPSVRSFADLRRTAGASRAPEPFLGFGDFRPASDPARIRPGIREACVEDRSRLTALGALPATAGEVRTVAQALGAAPDAVVLGDAFTRKGVSARALDRYRVVYFATHALLPNDLECLTEPALMLTPTADAGGLLEASEILDMTLDADLVVLSACNTAGAEGETGGEALSGLARSFFYAGARALLVSHWLVEDRATAQLMTSLFSRQSQTAGKAAALRQAQLSILQGAGDAFPVYWSHPLFWGAFTLVGDGAARPAS